MRANVRPVTSAYRERVTRTEERCEAVPVDVRVHLAHAALAVIATNCGLDASTSRTLPWIPAVGAP